MGILSRFFGGARDGAVPDLPIEGRAPEFAGIAAWLNSAPLTMAALRGKVVLVDFWTYSCVNCIRTLPMVAAWHRTYKDKGLVIVGVHTPEFDFEKDEANVRDAIARYGVEYPVALDNAYATWNAYKNRYWPAHYFIDASGNVRYHHFGEGAYAESEAVIRALLEEAGTNAGAASGAGAREIEERRDVTRETYLGFARAEYMGSPESVRKGVPQRYSAVKDPAPNVYYLEGLWEIGESSAIAREPGARIVYKVHASSVHAVMEGPADGADVTVRLDGAPVPADRRGPDLGANGATRVAEGRLYDLVDLHGRFGTHLVELTFTTPGTTIYSFTFG